MINPWRKGHVDSAFSTDPTSTVVEDQDSRGGKRRKPNEDRGVGHHKVVHSTVVANPVPAPKVLDDSMDKLEQGSDADADEVSHTNEECPPSEASDSYANVSTPAMSSSYSGYPTDDVEQA